MVTSISGGGLYLTELCNELEEEFKQKVLRLARECPVYKTLSKPLEFTTV